MLSSPITERLDVAHAGCARWNHGTAPCGCGRHSHSGIGNAYRTTAAPGLDMHGVSPGASRYLGLYGGCVYRLYVIAAVKRVSHGNNVLRRTGRGIRTESERG